MAPKALKSNMSREHLPPPSTSGKPRDGSHDPMLFWWVIGLIVLALGLGVAIFVKGVPFTWALLLIAYVWAMCIVIVASDD